MPIHFVEPEAQIFLRRAAGDPVQEGVGPSHLLFGVLLRKFWENLAAKVH